MDFDAVLAPVPGDTPSGENLRYTSVYDQIQEARRADDVLNQGDWQHEVKTSDWNTVLSLSMEALTLKTKDLQLAAWLMEALTITRGFEGVNQGLIILSEFLIQFWDTLYPEIEEEDLDYRAGPLEFVNDKLWLPIKEIPITDPGRTPGFSWMKWQESRKVGLEKDTLNQYGDVDDAKKRARDDLIAEGKLTAEEFDIAVKASSRAFYETLFENISKCVDRFTVLDMTVDEKFGRDAPRLAELKTSLEDCLALVTKFVKLKREEEPGPVTDAPEQTMEGQGATSIKKEDTVFAAPVLTQPQASVSIDRGSMAGSYHVNRILGSAGLEEAVWQAVLKKLAQEGIKPALEQLLGASCSAQSIREKTNFRLLMARLCLKAGRVDLARPIMEELNTLVEELALNRWESPIWVAEVLGTLYQCLISEEASDDDHYRARDILTRLCTLDVTKAMEYSSRKTDEG